MDIIYPKNNPMKKKRRPHQGDKSRFKPKSMPGQKWGLDDYHMLIKQRNQSYRRSHYVETIVYILTLLQKQNPAHALTIKELMINIDKVFKAIHLHKSVKRKSVESALTRLRKNDKIKAVPKTVSNPNGPATVMAYRLATYQDSLDTLQKLLKKHLGFNNKLPYAS